MTGSVRVPRTELTGIQGGLLKLAIRKKIGHVPENVEVMWKPSGRLQGPDADGWQG